METVERVHVTNRDLGLGSFYRSNRDIPRQVHAIDTDTVNIYLVISMVIAVIVSRGRPTQRTVPVAMKVPHADDYLLIV